MAISDKLRALLALKGKKSTDLAAYFGITPQAMRNKFSRGSFSADDLIKMALFLDAELSFRASDQVITLDKSDLQVSGKVGTPIPDMGNIVRIDGDQLTDRAGRVWDAGVVKANLTLGGGFELCGIEDKSTPKKKNPDE